MANKIRFLERTYLTIIVIIFLLIALTPYLIRSGFAVIDEELAEIVCIILLFAVGYAVFFSYRKETTRNQNERIRLEQDKTALEDRLTEAFKYIGAVNIQIEQIRSVFTNIRKFPENKKDFGHILQFLAERTLSMVNADWLFFRIIDIRNLGSLGEYGASRGNAFLPKCKISNRMLTSRERIQGFTVVSSGHENLHIRTFCIFPKAKFSGEEKVFVEAVVNQLEMLFLIFSSVYYKNSHANNVKLPGLLEQHGGT